MDYMYSALSQCHADAVHDRDRLSQKKVANSDCRKSDSPSLSSHSFSPKRLTAMAKRKFYTGKHFILLLFVINTRNRHEQHVYNVVTVNIFNYERN